MGHVNKSALALISGGIDIRSAQAQLNQIREYISDEQDPTVVREAIDRAKLATEWAKLKEVSGEVAKHAVILNIVAVRKLGSLGDSAVALLEKPSDQRAAKFLAWEVDDDQFEKFLKDLSFKSLNMFVGEVRQHFKDEASLELGRKIAEGKGQNASDEQALHMGRMEKWRKRHSSDWADGERERIRTSESERRTEAINGLLDNLYQSGDKFAVSDVVDELLDADILGEKIHDPRSGDLIRLGMSQVVRASLTQSQCEDTSYGTPIVGRRGEAVKPPQFVTYRESDGRGDLVWVRIPFSVATLSQLTAMATQRRQQSDLLQRKAEDLEDAVDALHRVAKTSDGTESLARLWRDARVAERGAA